MLNNNKVIILIVIILVTLSAASIGIRMKYKQGSRFSQRGSAWQLVYDIEFQATKTGKRLYVTLPSNTVSVNIVSETFSRTGPIIDVLYDNKTLEREAVVAVSNYSKPLRFTAKFDIYISSDSKRAPTYSTKSSLTTVTKAEYLRQEYFIQKNDPAVTKVLADISRDHINKSTLIERIFAYCSENLIQIADSGPSDAVGSLSVGKCSAIGCGRTMVALCRAGRVPSRLVTGFVLQDDQDFKPFTWVEVYYDKHWIPYDPYNGYSKQLPVNYLPVRHGGISIARASKGRIVKENYTLNRINPSPELTTSAEGAFGNIMDLNRLPISMRKTLSLILLLPAGALLTAIFRNIIGIKTFGIFTPTLLALSLVNSDWKIGIIILLLSLIMGLLCRLMLDWLKLLEVPRLGIILTLVVLYLALSISVLEYYGLAPSARSILLPIVIITMMIERFYICYEEDGGKSALQVLAYTIIVAGCCFSVLHFEPIGWFVISFPETQLSIIAVFILIGRYSGYRLSELLRFRDFAHLKS